MLFAEAYLKTGRLDNAQSYIDRAIALGGGEELAVLGKDLALKSLHGWLDHNPDKVAVRRQYAILLLRFGDFGNARTQYEQIIKAQPLDALSLNNLAWLVQADDPARALDLATRAVKQDPNSPDFLDTLGWMQLKRSDPRNALTSLQQAHQRRPSDPQLSYHLALALDANGARGAAKSLLQQAIAQGGFADLNAAKKLLASWR